MEEFIKVRQGGMSVVDYLLMFTKLSNYAPSLASNPRDEMSRFIRGVFNELVEECHSFIHHNNVNITRLLVHS